MHACIPIMLLSYHTASRITSSPYVFPSMPALALFDQPRSGLHTARTIGPCSLLFLHAMPYNLPRTMVRGKDCYPFSCYFSRFSKVIGRIQWTRSDRDRMLPHDVARVCLAETATYLQKQAHLRCSRHAIMYALVRIGNMWLRFIFLLDLFRIAHGSYVRQVEGFIYCCWAPTTCGHRAEV